MIAKPTLRNVMKIPPVPSPRIKGDSFPCFLCGNGIPVKFTKKQKPYLTCDPCGIQIFIRRKEGIALFEKCLRFFDSNVISSPNPKFQRVIGLVNKFIFLRAKLSELQYSASPLDVLFGSNELEIAMDAIEREMEKIESAMRSIR